MTDPPVLRGSGPERHRRSTDDKQPTRRQIVTGIFGTPTSRRERELAERVTLLENYAFELQEANDRLEQQLAEARDQIKTLKGMR
jgi:hypothetical protein